MECKKGICLYWRNDLDYEFNDHHVACKAGHCWLCCWDVSECEDYIPTNGRNS